MPRPPLTQDQAQQARMRAVASREDRGDQATLDKFAAAALTGILASAYSWQKGNDKPSVRLVARKSYDFASEMLYQRSIRDSIGVIGEDLEGEEEEDED